MEWGPLIAESSMINRPNYSGQLSAPYSLRAIYFRRELYKSTVTCLTAAHAQHLPLEV